MAKYRYINMDELDWISSENQMIFIMDGMGKGAIMKPMTIDDVRVWACSSKAFTNEYAEQVYRSLLLDEENTD
jgi:hypothetical protein